MAATPEIRGKIGIDTSDLGRAEVQVRNFDRLLKDSFKREPGMRGRTAIEQAVGDLTSGNVTGAIDSIAMKFSGLGILGGASLGIIAIGMTKVVEGTKEFNAAMASSDAVLARMPAAGASMELIAKHLTEIGAQQDKLSTSGARLGQISMDIAGGLGGTPFSATIAAKQNVIELSDQYAKSLDREVDKARQVAQVHELMAAGFKSEAEALKQRIALGETKADVEDKAKQMREDVAKRKLGGPQEAQELSAIDAWETFQKKIAEESAKRVSGFGTLSPLLDRAKLTGKEIQGGEGSLSDRLLMQQSDRAAALGETFRKQGFTGLAAEQFAKSDMWKSQMTGIKESEKPGAEIAAAISNATVFQNMLGELQALNGNVKDIDFSNR